MSSDFELPGQPSKRQGIKPAKTKIDVDSLSNSEEVKMDTDIDERKKEEAEKSKPKYPKEELLRVFDEIIFSGEYSEDYLIRNRVPVTFRTRTVEQLNTIQKTVDSAGANLIATVETMRTLMNLHYSLVSYDKKTLSSLKMEDRAKFVNSLPGPVVGLLIEMMSKFDEKVGLACQEGEENF